MKTQKVTKRKKGFMVAPKAGKKKNIKSKYSNGGEIKRIKQKLL